MTKPRSWQIEAKAKFQLKGSKSFLLDVTPGAGKTLFAAMCAELLFEQRRIDFVVAVVPNTSIKGDKDAGFLGDWNAAGIQITTVLKEGRGRPLQFRGAVITYSQLPNMISTFETWAREGVRLFAIFDEIHHASENTWGSATEMLGKIAHHILCMTGTCFRGDGHRISFVEYDANGLAVPDYRYSYRKAVTDKICRKVDFITDDSLTEFELDKADFAVRISEAKTDDQLRGATATLFRTDHDYLRRVFEKASDCLEQYRSWDRDAAALVVCRSGKDDNDDRHLHYVARLIHEVLGEEPVVISYDDKDANAKIERFRKSDQRWICAVRKISEGVDIKRLRVEVMATRPTSELLFRQLVGRVVRVDDDKRPGDATVFIPRFPQLVEWATTIAEEAKAGLAERRPNGGGGNKPGEARSFSSRAATHEDGGAISDFGDQFDADEINAAERLRGGKRLSANPMPNSNDDIDLLQQLIMHGGEQAFSLVPAALKKVLVEEQWHHRVDKDGKPFASFEAFVTHRLWQGLETTIDDLRVYCRKHEDVVKLILGKMDDGPTLADAGAKGGRGKKATCNTSGFYGATYLLKRLKRDHPELFQQVLGGALSTNAAAKEAGIRKPPSPLKELRKWWSKASSDERAAFLAEISARMAA